ncbi:hypothetical protein SNS2_2968 [Streptomyces netropsis]|nr:hypothetical protein SNS2_2968 [Streptomyces netropsis]
MTAWDITPSGVKSVLSLVELAADDLGKDFKGYGEHLKDAVLSAGTISGPYCGNAPVGPVDVALASFASDAESQIRFVAARIKKTMEGTVDAVTAYVEGDVAMAAHAQREAAKAPTPRELKAVGEKADHRGGE